MYALEKSLHASTWQELETVGKFSENDKLSSISDEMPADRWHRIADRRRLQVQYNLSTFISEWK